MLFRVIFADDGEQATSQTFASASEALAARPMLEMQTGKRTRIAKIETQGDAWKDRERALFDNGTRKPLPSWWLDSPWWLDNQVIHQDHFPHLSTKTPGMIAFTETPEKGARDIQTPISPSRYLARFFGDILWPEQISEIAARFLGGDVTLKIGHTPEEFEDVYRRAVNVCAEDSTYRSCMSPFFQNTLGKHLANLPHHPAYVYGAGDLAIAYVEAGTEIVSRAVIWPAKKQFVRLYGVAKPDCATLRALLVHEGYEQVTDFRRARLLKIETRGGWLMPYLDGDDQTVEDRSDHFRTGGGDFDCTETCGFVQDGDSCRCDSCGARMDRDYSNNVQGERWCESCYENDTVYCGYTEETFPASYGFRTVIVGRVRRETWNYRAARNHAFRCENTDALYSNQDFTEIEVETRDGTQTWCEEVNREDYFEDIDGNYFAAADFTPIEVVQEDGSIATYCKEEPSSQIFYCEACSKWHVIEMQSEDPAMCQTCALQGASPQGKVEDDAQITLAL